MAIAVQVSHHACAVEFSLLKESYVVLLAILVACAVGVFTSAFELVVLHKPSIDVVVLANHFHAPPRTALGAHDPVAFIG